MAYLEYVESKVRTSRLYCSSCRNKIKVGEKVIFGLNDDRKMEEVFCDNCKYTVEHEVYDDHPFSSDALGQD